MLFQKHNGLFHWINFIEGPVSDHFDISDMFHDFHEKFFVLLFYSSFWNNFDTRTYLFDKVLDILDFYDCVVHEEAGVAVNPLSHSIL